MSDTEADKRLSDEYRVSVGQVMAARQKVADVANAGEAEGIEADEELNRALDARDVLRERYDEVLRHGSTRRD